MWHAACKYKFACEMYKEIVERNVSIRIDYEVHNGTDLRKTTSPNPFWKARASGPDSSSSRRVHACTQSARSKTEARVNIVPV